MTAIDAGDWPRGVMDPLCPSEHVIAESMDRRVLWHLENQLAVSATTDYLKEAARNLRRYLYATCAHHWHDHAEYEDMPPIRQCLWCNDVKDMDEPATSGRVLHGVGGMSVPCYGDGCLHCPTTPEQSEEG